MSLLRRFLLDLEGSGEGDSRGKDIGNTMRSRGDDDPSDRFGFLFSLSHREVILFRYRLNLFRLLLDRRAHDIQVERRPHRGRRSRRRSWFNRFIPLKAEYTNVVIQLTQRFPVVGSIHCSRVERGIQPGLSRCSTTACASPQGAISSRAGLLRACLPWALLASGFLPSPRWRDRRHTHLRNAWVAPRPEQKTEAGARVLHSHSPLDWGGRGTELRRHQPREGALLDSCHQRIVSPVPSRRNPGRRFGHKTDAGPAEFTLGMGRGGDHHSSNVRRGHSYVCCVDSRSAALGSQLAEYLFVTL
jgi:hypothetical protein